MKYAFPLDKFKDKKGEIRIDCRSNNAEHTLVFSDNGVGLPEDIDIQETETLGMELVTTLVKQLGGNIELNRNNGTEFKITFSV
jgi:two-component sensor histidine kinase